METIHRDNEVILIRHAQSEWNRDNRFSGWADPALTEAGITEAQQAARQLRQAGYRFDFSYSSRLQRARHTLEILLDELGQEALPREAAWQLNERHYGALQGLDKGETERRAGSEQVWRWRRGYLDLPPPLAAGDARHPLHDPAYADVPAQQLPALENLDMTRTRVMAYWEAQIAPRLQRGERLLISAHGNTLRALIMDLSGMSAAQVEQFEIPTAAPIVYRFSAEGRPQGWHYLEAQPCIGCAA